jgi:hypothetical protein
MVMEIITLGISALALVGMGVAALIMVWTDPKQ